MSEAAVPVESKNKLLTPFNVIGGIIVIVALGIAAVRFAKGLGAVTNLNDDFPWGLWIGFDVLCGVALAAGGYTLAATVHIFRLKQYRPPDTPPSDPDRVPRLLLRCGSSTRGPRASLADRLSGLLHVRGRLGDVLSCMACVSLSHVSIHRIRARHH